VAIELHFACHETAWADIFRCKCRYFSLQVQISSAASADSPHGKCEFTPNSGNVSLIILIGQTEKAVKVFPESLPKSS
jgi:hypothetical protein